MDRAKGVLIDKFKMSENDAFVFIQRMAMSERKRMGEIAEQIIAGTLNP
ncbi:MAG: ANTAR domain-containing protein [Actinomycetota bacterium]